LSFRRKSRATPTLAVFALLVLGVQWLLSPALLSSNRYVWCDEHHHFEHVDEDSPHREGLLPADFVATAFQRSGDTSRPHSHDACPELTQLNQYHGMSLPFVAQPLSPVESSLVAAGPACLSSVCIRLLAPKNSPPA